MNDKTLAIIETNARGAMIPRNFEGVYRLSQIMAASGMMPKGMEKTETVFVAIQFGMEVGLSPMAAVQNLAVVNGRPCLWGDSLLGLVRGSGLLVGIIETTIGEGDATTATCTVTRRDDPGETVGRFSVSDAKRAGLWGKAGPWTQYPRRMLQMRARGYALRDKFPDVLKGLYAREEIEYERDMGQAEVVSSADTLKQIIARQQLEPARQQLEPQADLGLFVASDAMEWIKTAKTSDDIDRINADAKDVDMTDAQRVEFNAALAAKDLEIENGISITDLEHEHSGA